jgi:hypothetical protein
MLGYKSDIKALVAAQIQRQPYTAKPAANNHNLAGRH